MKWSNVTPPPGPMHAFGSISAALKVAGSHASFAFTMTSRGTDAAVRPEAAELATPETSKLDGPVGETVVPGADCPLVHPNRASTVRPTIKRNRIVLAPSPRGGREEQTRCRMNLVDEIHRVHGRRRQTRADI